MYFSWLRKMGWKNRKYNHARGCTVKIDSWNLEPFLYSITPKKKKQSFLCHPLLNAWIKTWFWKKSPLKSQNTKKYNFLLIWKKTLHILFMIYDQVFHIDISQWSLSVWWLYLFTLRTGVHCKLFFLNSYLF